MAVVVAALVVFIVVVLLAGVVVRSGAFAPSGRIPLLGVSSNTTNSGVAEVCVRGETAYGGVAVRIDGAMNVWVVGMLILRL